MNIEQVREYALSLLGVTEDRPFGDDIITFRVEGKIFLCLWLGDENDKPDNEPRFAIKLTPERNEELRERYTAITPAWHWNKKHWSDVCYETMDDVFVISLMKESYNLIVSQLPKRLQVNYQTERG